ncbi:uncharacterized protein BDZ99DRAFT_463416 [Mytilinidion resinicola]|uniref:Carboxylesterase family protein n=1 Tax=Mytilinidion resinicola TaxID=574789 RepID=A0A6A6YLH2_9PEZI|nr:uncharacterized protein BDZ99DRAFT_463416 [Mytilinidion resinicola]KAF2809631.1 hypothetical protein BDZ99DRAFT_463416 [Mytilinidion resinicola]
MRQTRSALRAEAIHVDDSSAAAVPLPFTPFKERAPLGEIAGNTAVIEVEKGEEMAQGKKAKAAKGGRKGKKGKKAEEEIEVEQQQAVVLEDERQAAGSPASDGAVEELAKEGNGDVVQVPMLEERPVSPPRAVRMTRRQLAKAEEELSKLQHQTPPIEEPVEEKVEQELEETSAPGIENVELEAELVEPEAQVVEPEEAAPIQQEVSQSSPAQEEAPEPTVEVVGSPAPEVIITPDLSELKVLMSEKPSEEEVPSIRSSSRSPGRSPIRLEDSIEALDALDDAIEQVAKAFPHLDALESGEKSPTKKPTTRATPKARTATAKPLTTKAPVTNRVSRNPTVPKSLKEGPTTSTATKTRPLSTARPSLARSASVRNASKANEPKPKAASGEVTGYLASKRRPISVSFPTPPPPPKSTKPPTKSTFQLPGEAVAARLKAQREERQKREEEEAAKKPTFKARPAPVRKAPALVKQTAASKARESLMQGGSTEEKENDPTNAISLKRTSSTTTATSAKRQSTLITNTKSQSSLLSGTHTPTNPAEKRERPAFNLSTANTAVKRVSSIGGPTIPPLHKPAMTPADVATQRLKGREVFNRDKMENQERERIRREKEDAAKRARAEAAERGRIASREWAEKQKMRKAGLPAANGGIKTAAAGAGMEQTATS